MLKEKLKDKSAIIGIFGLGYVGLPLLLRFIEEGYKVIGFDIDREKVELLNDGKSYIKHIAPSLISKAIECGFEATTDFSRAELVDALIICVPTPLTEHREPDLSFVICTVESLLPHIRPEQMLSLESTTYPGTTEEVLQPRIESHGLTVGKDFFLVYSPEREDPANPGFSTRSIPKICGGQTRECLEMGVALYSEVIDTVVPLSSTRTAELTKLLENIHRSVNIGLVNEMKIIADRMDIDIFEVIDAAATKPFGFVPYYPGPGLGGHCIPIDPFYLTWKAREFDLDTRFIELAGEVNTAMPDFVIGKLTDGLNERCKSVKGSKILILGVAYKKNVDDMRESPGVKIMQKLFNKGADVEYSDPNVPRFPKLRDHDFDMASIPITADSLKVYDAVMLVTDHDDFDYRLIQKHAELVVDTRGRYRDTYENVIRA